MRLAERIHLVGSGAFGFDLTDPYDCHIYLVDGGDELALIDVGAGMGAERVVDNVGAAGFDPARIARILCTHAHGDHAGGAARMRRLLPAARLGIAAEAADWLRDGDEEATSITPAKRGGIYPPAYVFEACNVDDELGDGDRIVVGDVSLECIATPGHADAHLAFLLTTAESQTLFAGDVVFHGGTILLQATYDCRLDKLVASLRRLRSLDIDALLPGHFSPALHRGQRHIEKANVILDSLLIPPQAVNAW